MRIRNRARGGLWWRIPTALAVWALVAAPQVAAIVLYRTLRHYARDLPVVPDLAAWARRAPATNRLVAADGTILAEIPFVQGKEAGHRTWVVFAEIPPLVIQAVLAAEDVRFFEHTGVDVRAVARAAWANYRAGRTVEGASTLTQQVARNLLPEELGREKTWARKIREAILARRIERSSTKAQIFETWANQVFLGNNAYGLAAAARGYFDKPLAELGPGEAALIAGLAQAPGRADPTVDLAAAQARRDEVLDRMQRAGFLDEAARQAAAAAPIVLRRPVDPYGRIAPWITERARREITEANSDLFARGGLVIETSALPAAHAAAEAIAREGAARLGGPRGKAGGVAGGPQVGAYVLDHTTGYVEAIVGGLGWDASRFDRATQACRQPGSAFKPIVYAAALERDRITPGTPLRDAPITEYDEDRDVFWKPHNSGRSFRGVAVAQDALAASLNAPAVDVLDRVGPEAAVALAKRLGLTTAIDPVRPLVLGASCVIPAELARAFGTFAAGGRLPAAAVIVRILDRGTTLLDRAAPGDPFLDPARRLDRAVAEVIAGDAGRVLDPETAFLMSSMLAQVVAAGTGHDARAVGRPAAGKTGTTNDNSDAWFVGYTGRLVAAVWVGHDDPAVKLGAGQDGAHAALPVWVRLVKALEGDRPPVPVPGKPAPNVVSARVDRETGLLARPGAGGAIDLWFRKGTAPTEVVDEVRDVPGEIDGLSRESNPDHPPDVVAVDDW